MLRDTTPARAFSSEQTPCVFTHRHIQGMNFFGSFTTCPNYAQFQIRRNESPDIPFVFTPAIPARSAPAASAGCPHTILHPFAVHSGNSSTCSLSSGLPWTWASLGGSSEVFLVFLVFLLNKFVPGMTCNVTCLARAKIREVYSRISPNYLRLETCINTDVRVDVFSNKIISLPSYFRVEIIFRT